MDTPILTNAELTAQIARINQALARMEREHSLALSMTFIQRLRWLINGMPFLE